MANELVAKRSFDEVERMAVAIARSRLFGVTQVEQVIALMLMAEAEGRHVASAMQDYSVIQGKPSLKAEAMQARFQQAGGKIKWTCLTDERVAAIFSHATCEPVEVDWDMDRARKAGLGGKDMWKKFPRQMLRARVISEGVRTAFPGALGGMYAPEEVIDFAPTPQPVIAHESEPSVVVSFHDQASNVPGGFKSLKAIEVDAEQVTDHTADPDWSILSAQLNGNCETRDDVLDWWKSVGKDLKARKPHFAKAFHQQVVIPTAAALAPATVWEDEAGVRG